MQQKRRSGSVAALLSFIVPGTGFLYAGWWKLALFVFMLIFIAITFIGGTRFILSPWGIYSVLFVILISSFLSVIFSFILARRSPVEAVNKGQNGSIYLLFILVSLFLAALLFVQRASFLGYKVHVLPSRSMANTLLPHDYIMVDTWAYKDTNPKRGDIIVFNYPPKPEILFIKRVVAVGGDWVVLENGKLSVNGHKVIEPYVLTTHNAKTVKAPGQEWFVPKGKYFVLGDNRDNSNDSRYWGYLERDMIEGKARSIWFSYFVKKGVKLRWERLGFLQ